MEEHNWIEDLLYIPNEDSTHTKKWDCQNCSATKHEWVGIRNGKLKKSYYILVKDTQYGLNHKCNYNEKINDNVTNNAVIVSINNERGQYSFNFGE
jgi:hypothetical protein